MTAIDNPVINSPFVEPAKHFRVVDGLVSGEIEPKRRPSEFFVPVGKPKKASAQTLAGLLEIADREFQAIQDDSHRPPRGSTPGLDGRSLH